VRRFDLRPGGEWSFLGRDEKGAGFPFGGTFLEISPCTRLVYTMRFEADGWQGGEALVSNLLEQIEHGTRLTAVSTFATKKDRQAWIDSGAEAGGRMHFDRLADFLANEWSGAPISPKLPRSEAVEGTRTS
jgi:uncharacterized protein YndB with AHSA1/START domain